MISASGEKKPEDKSPYITRGEETFYFSGAEGTIRDGGGRHAFESVYCAVYRDSSMRREFSLLPVSNTFPRRH